MGYTISVAARALGISAQTVSDWSKRGILHPTRTTSGIRYWDPREIERVLAERQERFATTTCRQ